MPTYDYVCANGHRFEVLHGVNDAGPAACPVCSSHDVRKAFTTPTIHFKGSGWAKKDRGSSARRSSSSTGSDGGSSSGDGSAPAKTGTEGSGSGSTKESSGSGTKESSGSSSSSSTSDAG